MNKTQMATLVAGLVFLVACSGEKNEAQAPVTEQQACAPVAVDDPQTVELQAGLSSRILTQGCGEVAATTGQFATVHTTGYLFDTTRENNRGDKFWSSYDPPGDAFRFQLGGRVIKGWNLGVPGMVEGEVRELTIAPDLGYGPAGSGPIPPNSTLVFQIELLALEGSVVEAAPASSE